MNKLLYSNCGVNKLQNFLSTIFLPRKYNICCQKHDLDYKNKVERKEADCFLKCLGDSIMALLIYKLVRKYGEKYWKRI